jgi:hypothetical protein
MSSAFFMPPPAGLDPEQQANRTRRQYVADCALEFLAAKAKPLDSALIAHLQDYVNGDSTLGQAIGRIVDHLAQEPHGLESVSIS